MKKKIIIFDNLTTLNIFIFFVFKLLGFEVYYVAIKIKLRKKIIIKKLEHFGIKWFNYQKFDNDEVFSNKLKISSLFCDKFTNLVSKNIWSKQLDKVFLDKNYLSACLDHKIKDKSNDIIELFEIAKTLKKNNKIYVWCNNSHLSKEINKKFYRIKNLNFFLYVGLISILLTLLKKFISYLLILVKKIIFNLYQRMDVSFFFKNKVIVTVAKNNFKSLYKSSRIVFFPHKGMFTQNSVKDYFYSRNKKSLFYKNKILHIEWNKDDLVSQVANGEYNTIKYYHKNKIPFFFWNEFNFKKEAIVELIKFVFKTKFLILTLIKNDILYHFYISATHIIHAKKKLERLNNIKFVLVGYDNLFPPELSVACKLLKIKTIALQDRIIVPSWSHKMIFDYYIILGKKSFDIINSRMKNSIKNILCVNQVKIIKYKSNLKKKNSLINNKKYKCLVIDMHSQPIKEWYVNGRSINNWRANKEFYEDIIYLANKFKNIEFLIKSKNYLWVENPKFSKIFKKMRKIDNIKILKNQKIWTPVLSLSVADFAIARCSSLMDECLNLNKPIILCDLKGYPQKFFDYGDNLVSYNLTQVENKIDKLRKNFKKFNQSLNKDRKKLFFSKKNMSLHSILENLVRIN